MISEVFFIFLVILYLFYDICKKIKPSGTPPGSLGYPIVGCIPPKNISYEEYLNKNRKKYGDTFWLKMGSRNIVIICEYETIVRAFNNPAILGRPNLYSINLFYQGKSKGIVFSDGTQWKDLRRFVIRRLRDGGMGKTSIESVILREAESLVEDFKKYVGKLQELPYSINGSILNVIWKLVSDQRYDVDSPEIHQLFHFITELTNENEEFFYLLMDFLPFLEAWTPAFIKKLFTNKRHMQKIDSLHQFIRNTLELHKEKLDENNPKDLIDDYLIEMKKIKNDNENESKVNQHFCETELMNTIFDLFTAGSETTSNAIRWYILLMVKFPQIQSKVQEELDRVIPKDKKVSLHDKENLPFFEASINETLRFRPFSPFGLFHVATEDTTIDGYLLPKDTYVMANNLASNKNPKFWEKPNDFYPEHFLNEDNTFNKKREGFLSFSTGHRVCLGENLARMDLFLILATLMQNFTFTAPEDEPVSIEQCPEQPVSTFPKPCKIIINNR